MTDTAPNNLFTLAGRVAVVQFPGTNCERETARSLRACTEAGLDALREPLEAQAA